MAFTVVATVALAQTPPANDPIKRTPLQKTEYPEGHFTYVMMVEIAPNATIARHTHPGIESSYVLDGNLDLVIEGKPSQAFKAGDSFTVPLNAVHGGKVGDKGLKLIGFYVVDKTKPLATPAPASQEGASRSHATESKSGRRPQRAAAPGSSRISPSSDGNCSIRGRGAMAATSRRTNGALAGRGPVRRSTK